MYLIEQFAVKEMKHVLSVQETEIIDIYMVTGCVLGVY